jgi:hypothetical protein
MEKETVRLMETQAISLLVGPPTDLGSKQIFRGPKNPDGDPMNEGSSEGMVQPPLPSQKIFIRGL